MKTFIQYLIESESDPRADINIPYKIPDDIKAAMASRGAESSEPGPSPRKIKSAEEIKKERRQRFNAQTRKNREKRTDTKVNREGSMTMAEVGKRMGLSKQMIDVIEKGAFEKIQTAMATLASDPSMQQAWADINKPNPNPNRRRRQ